MVPIHKELTPRQTAEILGVSRPVVMQLLKKGVIASRTVGTHHRIPLEDVLAYKRKRDVERRRELDLLARKSEEMGLHETARDPGSAKPEGHGLYEVR